MMRLPWPPVRCGFLDRDVPSLGLARPDSSQARFALLVNVGYFDESKHSLP